MIYSPRRIFNLTTAAYGRAARLLPSGFSPVALFVSCIVTCDCNMDCPFCLARGGRSPSSAPPLAADQWAEIFRQIPATALLGLSGGEVFCHPQPWRILAAAAGRHRVALVSNGLALDAVAAAELVALGAKNPFGRGLVQIGISINESLADDQACREALAEKLAIFDRIAARRRDAGKRFPLLELKVLVREETAGRLAIFAEALESPNVDAVAFQMLSNQHFASYLGLDPADSERIDALRDYKNAAPEPLAFSQIDALRESLAKLRSLPPARRNKIVFLPDISAEHFLAHYENRMNPSNFDCFNPWIHALIDPAGVAYQCFNPEGVDLRKKSFRSAWNSPGFRAFRRELREKRIFPCCAGCCFLSA